MIKVTIKKTDRQLDISNLYNSNNSNDIHRICNNGNPTNKLMHILRTSARGISLAHAIS